MRITFCSAAMLAMATLPAMAESAAPPIPRNPRSRHAPARVVDPGPRPSQPGCASSRRGRAQPAGNLK